MTIKTARLRGCTRLSSSARSKWRRVSSRNQELYALEMKHLLVAIGRDAGEHHFLGLPQLTDTLERASQIAIGSRRCHPTTENARQGMMLKPIDLGSEMYQRALVLANRIAGQPELVVQIEPRTTHLELACASGDDRIIAPSA